MLDVLQRNQNISASLVMRIITKFVLCSILFPFIGAVFGEDGSQVIPTKNQFAKQLSDSMQSMLTFVEKKESIQIQVKAKATLPLEFVPGKGLVASDGILSVGDSFAWPGCGFDRTRYTIRKITPEFAVIEYTRGNPQMDGYQDSGEFKIRFENDKDEE